MLSLRTPGVVARWYSTVWVKAALGSSENERWTVNSNRLVVFGASQQCIKEVDVESGGGTGF